MLPDKIIIKSRRKKLDLTQKTLAKMARISQSLLAKLESGKTAASYDKVKRIFEILDSFEAKDGKKAEDMMTKGVISMKPGDTVGDAVGKMKKYSISQMPVMAGGKSVGSISETGIISKMAEHNDMHKCSISQIMEDPLPAVSKCISITSLLPII